MYGVHVYCHALLCAHTLLKELANTVVAEHQKTVEYCSTDRVMSYSSFVDICKKAAGMDGESLAAIELWLLKERRIVKVADGRREVVKFCEKGESVTETDIGILR